MGTRFKLILDSLGYTNVEFAKEVGVSEGAIRAILTDKVKTLSPNIIDRLVKSGYNLHWLLTGDGEMFLASPQPSPKERELHSGINNNSGVIVTGNNNTIHHYSYKLDEAEKEVIDSIRQSKKRERVLAAIKAVLGIGVLVGVVNFFM